jgi:hypothetical protein
MKSTIVNVPSIKDPIKKSPGFAKKELADYKLDIMGRCQFQCSYCSSDHSNYLRINQERFADLTGEQTGVRRHHAAPLLHVLVALDARRLRHFAQRPELVLEDFKRCTHARILYKKI